MTPAEAVLRRLDDAFCDSDVLNLAYAVAVRGPVDEPALAGVLRALVQADPLLAELAWTSGPAGSAALAALAAAHLARPIRLGSEPVIRGALWSTSADEHLLLLAVHHAVADGVVLDRIARDASELLAGRSIAPVERLAHGRSALVWPVAAATREVTVRAGCLEQMLPAALATALIERTRAWRTTPFAAIVAATAAVLACHTGAAAIPVAIQIAGRRGTAEWRAAGAWYDSAVITLATRGDSSLRELLHDATREVTRAVSGPGRWAAPAVDDPAPAVLVVMDRHPLGALAIPGCAVRPLAVRRHPVRSTELGEISERLVATDADLVCFLRQDGARLCLAVFYKLARFEAGEAAGLAAAIIGAIEALCFADDRPIDDLAPPTTSRVEVGALRWPEPTLLDHPGVDAVSPAFALTPGVVARFAADAAAARASWGAPPWL